MILVDITAKKLDLLVDEKELERRRSEWKPSMQQVDSPYLNRYRRIVTSGARGAVIE
jgi:dihydroxy-acid dehydratase